jgi:CHAD domain-containing protein
MSRPEFTRICAQVLQDWKTTRRRVLKSGATRGAVHALRIQMRRLLALEALLAPRGGAIKAGLQDIFHESGRLRDAQLVVLEFRQLVGAIPGVRQFVKRERQREPRLARKLQRELRATPVSRLAPIVAGWLQTKRGVTPATPARRAANRLRLRHKRLAAISYRESTAAHSLHRHRINLKELRYMAELATAAGCALPRSLSLTEVAERQQQLGAVTDIDMQLHKIARFAARHAEWKPCALQLRRELQARRVMALRDLQSTAAIGKGSKPGGRRIR